MRLSEITDEPLVEEPKSYRLSDAMKITEHEIPQDPLGQDKGVGGNLVEGVVQAFASAPQVVGNITMAFGDFVRSEKHETVFGTKPLIDVRPLAERVYSLGKRITESNEKYIRKNFPEQENVTFADKFAKGVGQGSVSLVGALGMGFLLGPSAPAIAFGTSSGAEGFNEARKKDKDLDDALKIGATLGLVEGGLEFWGVKRIMALRGGTMKKALANTVNGAFTEFSQEFAQTGASETIKTATGLKEYKGEETVKQIIADSLFSGAIGAVLGGGAGVSMSLIQRQAVEEGLVASGMEKEAAGKKADVMMKETIEDLVTEIEILDEIVVEEKESLKEEVSSTETVIVEPTPTPKLSEVKTTKDKYELIKERIEAIKQQRTDKKVTKEAFSPQLEVAKESLSYLQDQKKQYAGRIQRYADGHLDEEFNELPAAFRTKDGITIDKAAQEAGFDSDMEFRDYLIDIDSQISKLKEQVKGLADKIKGEAETTFKKKEITILKQRISDFEQGVKRGEVKTRKEIREIQKELTDTIKGLEIEAKDKAKLLSSIKDANTDDKLYKITQKILDRAQKYAEATDKRAARDKIDTELKFTKPVKKGEKVVGKYNYLDNKYFDELRDINKLKQSDAQEQLDKMPTEDLSEADLIKARILSYKANGMSGSLEIHKQVLADIKALKHYGQLSKNEEDFFKAIEIQERVDEFSEAIENTVGNKDTFVEKVLNFYRTGFSTINSMMKSIAGVKIGDQYDPEGKEGHKTVGKREAQERLSKKIQEIYSLKHKDMALDVMNKMSEEKYTITDRDGLVHNITKAEIVDIYNSIKNGLVDERYTNAFSEEQVDSLVSEMTPNEFEVADYMMDVVQAYKPIMNQRHIEITGRDMGSVDNYWPATSEHKVDVFDDYKTQGETPSALKNRSDSSKIIPIPKNAFQKFNRAVDQAEHTIHLSREYETLKRILVNRKVKNRIVNKFGEDVYNHLLAQLENISLNKTTERGDALEGAMGQMLNNWVTAKVALNPNVFAKQLLSAVNYSEDMPAGKWAKGFFSGLSKPKETFNYMWEGSGGFLEERFNRGYSEALGDAIDGARQISTLKYSLTKGLSSFARAGDITAIVYGGYSYVKHLESTGMSKKEAFEKFKVKTLKSQQSRLSSGLSQWQNKHTAPSRLFLAFKNTSNQYFRKQMDAIIAYRNGDISKEQLAKTTVIYSVIAPAVYAYTGHAMAAGMKAIGEGVFGAYHDDDEENEGLMKVIVQIAANPFMAVPMLDDLAIASFRKLTGQKVYKVFSTPVFDDIETAFRKFSKEEPSLMDYFETFGTAVEIKTGVPVKTYLRMFKQLRGE